MEEFVIFWGCHKDGSPSFEQHIHTEEDIENPLNEDVMKFPSEAEAQEHLEESYPNPKIGEIIPLETAIEHYNDYLNKIA